MWRKRGIKVSAFPYSLARSSSIGFWGSSFNCANLQIVRGIVSGTADSSRSPAQGTVDQEEIERLSDHEGMRWWDPNGSMAPLHKMNPVRVAYIRMALCKHFKRNPLSPTPLKGLNIADIGCGPGLLCEVFVVIAFDLKLIASSPWLGLALMCWESMPR